jgi:signal transduction histidine kinase
MTRKQQFLVIFLASVVYTGTLAGQNPWTPASIRQAIRQTNGDKTNLYIRLFNSWKRTQIDSALAVTNEMIQVGQQSNNPGLRFEGQCRKVVSTLLQGKSDEAQRLFADLQKEYPSESGHRAHVLKFVQGTIWTVTGKSAESLDLNQALLKELETDRDTMLVTSVLANIARVQFSTTHIPEFQKTAFRLLGIAEQANLPIEQSNALQMLTLPYIAIGVDSANFFLYAKKCLEVARKYGVRADEGEIENRISSFYNVRKKKQESLKHALKSVAIMSETSLKARYAAAISSVGYVYQGAGQPDSARYWFDLSEKVAHDSGDEFSLNNSYIGRAAVFAALKQYDEAFALWLKALELCQKNGYSEREIDIQENIAEYYYRKGDFKTALDHFQHRRILSDSVYNIHTKDTLVKLQLSYEFQKKEDKLNYDKQLSHLINWIMAGILVLFMLAFLWFRTKQRLLEAKRRANELEGLRNQIAMDIHDEIGASLTKIHLTTQLASKMAIADPNLRQKFEDINQDSRVVSDSLRQLTFAVSPQYDHFDAVQSYFREWAQQFLEPAGMELHVDFSKLPGVNPILSPNLKSQLFAIWKEGLNNVVKHAGASRVHLIFNIDQDRYYEMQIIDNGKGFSPDEIRQTGNGLKGMEKRAASIGASLKITPLPGSGTNLTVKGRI